MTPESNENKDLTIVDYDESTKSEWINKPKNVNQIWITDRLIMIIKKKNLKLNSNNLFNLLSILIFKFKFYLSHYFNSE